MGEEEGSGKLVRMNILDNLHNMYAPLACTMYGLRLLVNERFPFPFLPCSEATTGFLRGPVHHSDIPDRILARRQKENLFRSAEIGDWKRMIMID